MERFIYDFIERQTGFKVIGMDRAYDRMGLNFTIYDPHNGYQSQYYLDESTVRLLESDYKNSQMSHTQLSSLYNSYSSGSSALMGFAQTYQGQKSIGGALINHGSTRPLDPPSPKPETKKVCTQCSHDNCDGELDSRGRCTYKSKKFAEKIRVLHLHRQKSNGKTTS